MARGHPHALATMLAFTASAHFTRLRHDLAAGLVVPRARLAAGIALIAFFILVFPANVKAARSGVGVGGKSATPLWLRAPMQVLFIAFTWWSAVWSRG